MPLVLGFAFLLGTVLLLGSGLTGASFADVIKGNAGKLYKEHEAALAKGPSSTSSASSPAAGPTSAAPAGSPLAGIPLSNPFAGAKHVTVGRTDMGVDASLSPGDPIRAIAKSKVVGTLQNWYSGQPYVWFEILDAAGRGTGHFWYVAEQIIPHVTTGQVVSAGQQVGTYAPSGTGLELGLAAASGQTLAQATTGYSEGQETAAGKLFAGILHSVGVG